MQSKPVRKPLRIVNSEAPIRVCDNGGWTDTWFAGHGQIFQIAVTPCVEVQMMVFRNEEGLPRITIHAENYGDHYSIEPPRSVYSKHPLIEAAMEYMGIPPDLSIEVTIYSEAPAGCSTGTSAAVSTALIGALDRLRHEHLTPHEVAMAAQTIETRMLGLQCGIQDQIASAYGGINFIEMHDYPHASVSQLRVREALRWELESRLSLVYVGQSHNSSDVHKQVIARLESGGASSGRLEPLRRCAREAKDALYAGDLAALGRSMIANTEAQAGLDPALVGAHHQAVIGVAHEFGALGWKVNGAGGDGGSLTILSGEERAARRAMLKAIEAAGPYRVIPIRLSAEGLRVWMCDGDVNVC
jgi:D-glycero-alpha-D-manno-heptose-7-phosphate kinase